MDARQFFGVDATTSVKQWFDENLVTPAGSSNTIAVPLGTLVLTGFAPTVTAGAGNTISVPLGTLSMTALVPTVATTANNQILVPLAALTLAGFAPTIVGVTPVNTGAVAPMGGGPNVRGHYDFLNPPQWHKRKREEEQAVPEAQPDAEVVVVAPIYQPSVLYDRLLQSIAAQKALRAQAEQRQQQEQQVAQQAAAQHAAYEQAAEQRRAVQTALEAEQARVRTIRRRAALLLLLH